MRSFLVVFLLFFTFLNVSSQSFITFKGDYIVSGGNMSLHQRIHSNSFKEEETLSTNNSEFALDIGILACVDEGISQYSATANIGVKHNRILAQNFPQNSNLNLNIPMPSVGAPAIFPHYQIGDYMLINNTGLSVNGEVLVYGFYLGAEFGGGLSKMKSRFTSNNSQNIKDAGWYYDGSICFGFSLRFVKIFYQWQTTNFGFNSVNWSAQGKKEKSFSSLGGKLISEGVGFSVVVPIPN
jgi:hypothetical protein